MALEKLTAEDVFKQDTEPQDTNDLWLDTNTTPPTLKQYDPNTSEWSSVASSAATVQDTEPQSPVEGDLWQDTSQNPAVLKQYDGNNWVGAITNTPDAEGFITDRKKILDVTFGEKSKQFTEKYILVYGYYIEANAGSANSAQANIKFIDGTTDSVDNSSNDVTFNSPKLLDNYGYNGEPNIDGNHSARVYIDVIIPTNHKHTI